MNLDQLNTALEQAQEFRVPIGITGSRWKPCDRAMWLEFRMALKNPFDAATLRTFDIGHALEDCMVKWLETAGLRVSLREAELKNDWGRYFSKIDGLLIYPSGEFRLLEMKTAKDSRFKQMVKNGIPANYYTQVQMYMHYSPQLSKKGNRLTKCLFMIVNKNDSDILFLDIDYDEAYAKEQLERIHHLMCSDELPQALTSYECQWCDYKDLCDGKALPDVHCRTCANVSVPMGQFECEHGDSVCDNHLIHPQLMELAGYQMVDVDPAALSVNYGDFRNTIRGVKTRDAACLSSEEIKTMHDKFGGKDDVLLEIVRVFGGEIE